MPEISLHVDWIGQEEPYYCGPAVAQMILAWLGVPAPVTPPTWQTDLWGEVQAQTFGDGCPSGGAGCPPDPSFPSQKCEKCSGFWNCWSTTPLALMRVLNQDQAAAKFSVEAFAQENDATTALLQTIDRNVPGVALVNGWQHFVVVEGYVYDEANPCAVNGRALNGVYICNPLDAPQDGAIYYVPCDSWHDNYLYFVACGEYVDNIVVLSATRQAPSAPTHVRLPGSRARKPLRS